MKIDAFNHIFPTALFDVLPDYMPNAQIDRLRSITTLWDIDARLRLLDEFGEDFCQILSLSQPPLDSITGPDDTPHLARVANDGMAAICRAHPDRFPGYIMSLPMNNPDAAVIEIDRNMEEHGVLGAQIHSNVSGKALDASEYFQIFERMAHHGRPVWLHPARPITHPDYMSEEISEFDIWWGMGWPMETSTAMARLVFSGMFDKLPHLKVICHHWGAYIPHAEGRLKHHWPGRKSQSDKYQYEPIGSKLKRPVIDYFKDFLGDTAMFGALAASQAGLDFFGAGNSVFATDCPYDREGGRMLIRDTLEVMENLRCTGEDRQNMFEGNVKRLLDLK